MMGWETIATQTQKIYRASREYKIKYGQDWVAKGGDWVKDAHASMTIEEARKAYDRGEYEMAQRRHETNRYADGWRVVTELVIKRRSRAEAPRGWFGRAEYSDGKGGKRNARSIKSERLDRPHILRRRGAA